MTRCLIFIFTGFSFTMFKIRHYIDDSANEVQSSEFGCGSQLEKSQWNILLSRVFLCPPRSVYTSRYVLYRTTCNVTTVCLSFADTYQYISVQVIPCRWCSCFQFTHVRINSFRNPSKACLQLENQILCQLFSGFLILISNNLGVFVNFYLELYEAQLLVECLTNH